jgi:DNA-binding CsgD family transcriptional regulator/PAS domain-containing protein
MTPDTPCAGLIGRIYDCALDAALWPDLLAELTDALGGLMSDIGVYDPRTGVARLTIQHNWPRDLAEMAEVYYRSNPAHAARPLLPLLEPHTTARDFGTETFHNSCFWQLCFAGRGCHDYLATGLAREAGCVTGFGVVGGEARGDFGEEDVALARLVAPHIKRCLRIAGALGYLEMTAGTLRAALDALADAALIIDPDGTIRYRNAAAEDELGRHRLFREAGGRLVGTTGKATKLLAELSACSRARHQNGRDALLEDPAGRAIHITWAALERAGEEIGSPVLMLLRQPQRDMQKPVFAATRVFGLTAAEAQVLGQVLAGHKLAAGAASLGVARSTAKSHLDAIYRKTNTHRQAELVSLALGLASPLRG